MKAPGQFRHSIRPKQPHLPFGVYWRKRARPYIVKFWQKQSKRYTYVGSFRDLAAASDAAADFVRTYR